MTIPITLQGLFRCCFTFIVLLDDYNGSTVGGEIKLYGWLYS